MMTLHDLLLSTMNGKPIVYGLGPKEYWAGMFIQHCIIAKQKVSAHGWSYIDVHYIFIEDSSLNLNVIV